MSFSFQLAAAVPGVALFPAEDEGRENLHSLDVGADNAVSSGHTSLLSPLARAGTALQQK